MLVETIEEKSVYKFREACSTDRALANICVAGIGNSLSDEAELTIGQQCIAYFFFFVINYGASEHQEWLGRIYFFGQVDWQWVTVSMRGCDSPVVDWKLHCFPSFIQGLTIPVLRERNIPSSGSKCSITVTHKRVFYKSIVFSP